MQQKLGIIFGFLFLLTGTINFMNNPIFFRFGVIINYTLAFLFGISCFYFKGAKLLQIVIFTFYGSYCLTTNDPNSAIPILSLILSLKLFYKYYTKYTFYSFFLFIPYIIFLLHTHLPLVSIVNNILLYIATTTILYIIHNDKT